MPILKKSSYTIKDIYALPEGERAELIDGRIHQHCWLIIINDNRSGQNL